MMNRKGFTLVELLAVIVILAILMVSAGAAVMSTLNNAKVNTFKNEALSAIGVADNLYTEISMNPADSNKYLKNSNDNNYKGMCVTLNGLVLSGYLNKDLGDGTTMRGVILFEVPFNGGATKRSIWITDGTYAITGYEQGKISSLRYKQSNNATVNGKRYYQVSNSGVVTNFATADKIIKLAHGTSQAEDGTGSCSYTATTASPTCTATGNAINNSGLKTSTAAKNRVLSSMYSPNTNQGGTGLHYDNIICINSSMNA